MDVLALALAWVDRWVPDDLEEDSRRMARAVVGMAFLILPWAPTIGGAIVAVGETIAGGAIVATGVVCLVLPTLVYRTGRVLLAANLLVLGLVQGLVVSALLLGGAGSPPTSWLALVPVIATATGGVRAGSVWTAIVMLAAVGIHTIQVTIGLPNPYLTGDWALIGTVSSVGLYFLVGVFLRANDHLYQRLLDRTRAAEERERAANRAKSGFLANMSHEIRTPLNAILGYTELVIEEVEEQGDTGIVEDLERVGRSSKHLLSLVNDILDLSKIEAGRLEVVVEEVAVGPLVVAVAEEVRPLVDAHSNQLDLELSDDIRVQADPARLRQCVLNLLSNAAKFTDGGRITVRVAQQADDVDITVTDTGIGMSPEQLERVFDPFAQASAETSRKYGGTGLGMSIARRLVELMGGDLSVVSAEGEGSAFTIRLRSTPLPDAGP